MAKMIPAFIDPDVKSTAERRFFDRLKGAPGTEEWVCLHSLGLARHESKRLGEIDFLLVTPAGILVVEVKGGRVARKEGVWEFTDKYGTVHKKVEGPFDQAKSAMFALEKDLRAKFGDGPRTSDCVFGFVVVFPDITFETFGPDIDPAMVIDRRDETRKLAHLVNRAFDYWRSRTRGTRRVLESSDIKVLVSYLRGDFDVKPSFLTDVNRVGSEIARWTDEQLGYLDSFMEEPRIIVDAGAGTGKTILAIESFKRHIRNGKRVLFLCYNSNLAKKIVQDLKSFDYESGGSTVSSLFKYFRELVSKAADHSLHEALKAEEQAGRYFDDSYLDIVLEVVCAHSTEYDVLIVDEAQDLFVGLLRFWGSHLGGFEGLGHQV